MSSQKISLSGIQVAIFDMDGTMVNNMSFHDRAWEGFLKKYNLSFDMELFRYKFSGRKNDEIFQGIFNQNLTKDEILQYTEEKELMYRELYRQYICEVPGLTQCIKKLEEAHIRLAIATTAPKKNRDFVLDSLGMREKFEIIFGDESVKKGKPHPEIYQNTALAFGVDPKHCFAFEDTPTGIASGKDAGMIVVAVLTTCNKEDLLRADYIVQDFSEIEFVYL